MEAFLLIIIVISLSILFYFARNKTPNLPPGSTGWPFLGENLDLASSGLENFIRRRMKMHSKEVFKTSIVGAKMAVICGAEGNKFIFTNENNNLFSTWWPASMIKPLSFPSSEDSSMKNRSLIVEFVRPEALKRYVAVMDLTARKQMETDWAPFEEIKVYPLTQKFTFSLACRLFLGVEDPKLVGLLSDAYNVAVSGMFSIPIDLPGTAYNRAMKGGQMVKDEFLRIIGERKKDRLLRRSSAGAAGGVDDSDDFLSRMLLRSDENGRFMTEMEIGNVVLGLMVASYDTTSSGATFALYYLSEFPDIYNKVYQEIMEIARTKGPQELLNWNDIRKMKYTWDVVCEAFRLTPPAQGTFRNATTDFTYAGFRIPKDWKMYWSVHSTHKDPKYFPDPERFDPSRFEGSGPAPYSFVPFGGGSRMCPGKEYARLEILVFLYNVVRRFKLEKLEPDEKVIFLLSPVPKNGLPVRLIPHRM